MKESHFVAEISQKRDYQEEFSKVAEMSPKELVEFFVGLDEKGELEGFLESAAENDQMKAKISYWEKWLGEDHRKLFEEIVGEKKEQYDGENSSRYVAFDMKENEICIVNSQG